MVIVSLAALSGFGCSSGEFPSSSAPVVHDSAGIQIVENVDSCWTADSGWSVAAEPSVSIGVATGATGYELFRVVAARRLSDGRIVLVNQGTSEIRFFNSDGDFLSAAGGQGEGPGEFDEISTAYVSAGDSIFVYESGQVTVLDPRGVFARTFPTVTHLPSTTAAIGLFKDYSTLLMIERPHNESMYRPGAWDSAAYYRLNADGALTDTLGRFFRAHLDVSAGERSVGWQEIPFGRTGSIVVAGDEFVYGSTASYEFRTFTKEGVLRRIARLKRVNAALTKEILDSLKQQRLELLPTSRGRDGVERLFSKAAVFGTTPAFSGFLADASGNLWVREYEQLDPSLDRWILLTASGDCIGAVSTPAELRIYEIGRDYVLGKTVDTLGVERVQVHALNKTEFQKSTWMLIQWH